MSNSSCSTPDCTHRTLTHQELVESLAKSFYCLHVQVIGRLIKNEEIWSVNNTTEIHQGLNNLVRVRDKMALQRFIAFSYIVNWL